MVIIDMKVPVDQGITKGKVLPRIPPDHYPSTGKVGRREKKAVLA